MDKFIYYKYFTNSSAKLLLKDSAKILTELYILTVGSNRKSSQCKVYDVMLNVLFNLSSIYSLTDSQKYGLKLTLRKEFFNTGIIVCGKRCKIPMSYRIFTSALDFLHENGFIRLTKGGKFIKKEIIDDCGEIKIIKTNKRETSIIEIKDKILPYCKDLVNCFRPDNVLILKNNKKVPIEFKTNPSLEFQIEMLKSYNENIDNSLIKDQNGQIIKEPFLKRVYVENFQHGGRFYTVTGDIQSMPSKERSCILIDGQPCVEIDIQAMHPAICYTECDSIMPEDPYDFEVYCDFDEDELKSFCKEFNLKDYDPLRNLRKIMLICAFNSKSLMDLVFTVSSKLGEDVKYRQNGEHLRRKFVGISNVSVKESINNMKDKNREISQFFHSNSGTILQYKDATFMAEVLSRCLQQGIIVIPVHDSVICQKEKQKDVEEIMEKSFEKVFGSVVNYRIKVK